MSKISDTNDLDKAVDVVDHNAARARDSMSQAVGLIVQMDEKSAIFIGALNQWIVVHICQPQLFFMIAMILMIYFWILFLLFYCLLFFDIFSSYLTRLSISNSGCAFDSWSNFGSHLTTEWNIQTIFLWLEIVAMIFIQNVFTKTIDYHVVWMKNSCLLYTGL